MRTRRRYRYLRFHVTNNGGLNSRVGRLEYYEVKAGKKRPPNMTSNTAPAPYVASATIDGVNAYLAFSGTNLDWWSSDNQGRQSIQIDFGPKQVNWRTGTWTLIDHVAAGRTAYNYHVYGSRDGKNWEHVKSRAIGLDANDHIMAMSLRSKPTILYDMMFSSKAPDADGAAGAELDYRGGIIIGPIGISI